MTQPRIAVQLYSVRDKLNDSLDGTLARLAEIGFEGVETAFDPTLDFDADGDYASAAQSIASHRLEICSSHVNLPIGSDRERVLYQASELGVRRLVWHGWPEDQRYGSLSGIQELIEECHEAADVAQANGLELGIHNHWWEMRSVEGTRPYQVLAEKLDPSIFFELDFYWTTVAGLDVVETIRHLDGRMPLVHVKDGPADSEDAPMVALGEGRVDLEAALRAASGADWFIVEFDSCETDIFEALEKSYRYLVEHGFAKAKRPA